MNRCECRPAVRGAEGREISVYVGERVVRVIADHIVEKGRRAPSSPEGEETTRERIRLAILVSPGGSELARQEWQDTENSRVEAHLDDVAAEIVVSGELQYREHAQALFAWRTKRKAELEEESRRRAAEQARRECERQIKLEQDRVERLLGEAKALRQANEIRAYVDAVRLANSAADDPLPPHELDAWATWALTQADRLDPIEAGTFQKLTAEQRGE